MAEEYFDIVNENDEIIGKANRSDLYTKDLIHRSVIIFIFNKKGELLLQKRSKFKDLWKSRWTGSASGHVALRESYETAAKRELKEELGIKIPLKQSLFLKIRQKVNSRNIKLFIGESNGPFTFNKKEIDKIRFLSLAKIKKRLKKRKKFTPTFVVALKAYLENLKKKN